MKRGFLATVALALAFGLAIGSVAFYSGDAWAQAGPTSALRVGGFNDDGEGNAIQASPGVAPFVVVPFSVSGGDDGGEIANFLIEMADVSDAVEDSVIQRLSIYRDATGDGRLDFNDTRIATLRNIPGDEDGDDVDDSEEFNMLDNDSAGDTHLSLDPDGETVGGDETRHYLVVVDSMASHVDVIGGETQDNKEFNFVVAVDFEDEDIADPADIDASNIVPTGSPPRAAKVLDVKATKLSFTSAPDVDTNAPSAFPQGQNAAFDSTVTSGTTITASGDDIRATDDYGNLDEDVSGGATVSAVLYSNPNTAATGTVSGSVSFGTGTGDLSASYTPLTSGARENITIVVTHDATGLEGSLSVHVGPDGIPVGTGPDVGRGVEFYDVDHNGYLDRCTIFFNGVIRHDNGLDDYNGFRVGGATDVFAAGTKPMVAMDNGGAGVRNAGHLGVTLFLKDGAFATDERPQVTYAPVEDTNDPVQYASDIDPDDPVGDPNDPVGPPVYDANEAYMSVANIANGQATEVDKARPVLYSARTQDANGNGEIDRYVLHFSEPVVNFDEAGIFTMTEAGLSFAATSTFEASGNMLTLMVNETGRSNTGLIPTFTYNEANAKDGASLLIQDSAKDATGADAGNRWEEDLTDYANFDDTDALVAGTAGAAPIPFAKRKDGVSPYVLSAVTDDDDRNGKIDEITVVFSERMLNKSLRGGVSFRDDLSNVFRVAGTAKLDATEERIIFSITEGTEYDTEATPDFLYDASRGDIRDGNDFPLRSFAAGAATAADGAAPHIVEAGFSDANANGLIDRVTLTFSEKIASKSDSTAYLDGLAVDYDADNDDEDRLLKTPATGQGHLNPVQDRQVRKADSGTGLAGLSTLVISFAERGVVSVDNTLATLAVEEVVANPGAQPPVDAVAAAAATFGDGDFNDPVRDVNGDGDTDDVGDNKKADVGGAPTAIDVSAVNGGDTGVLPDIVYDPDAGSLVDLKGVEVKAFESNDDSDDDLDVEKDRARPVILSVETGDSDAPSVPGGNDVANGDGFIDMLTIKTSESIKVPNSQVTGIQPFLTRKDDDSFSTVTIDSIRAADTDGRNSIQALGTSNEMVAKWDTGERPEIVYDDALAQIEDKADPANKMADKKIMAVDRAKPVIVKAVGVVGKKDINVQFSEPVGSQANAQYTGVGADDVTLTAAASSYFGYFDAYDPAGTTNAEAIAGDAASDKDGSDSAVTIQVDNTLLVEDVEQDSIYIRASNVIYDFASDRADSFNVNANSANGSSAGANLRVAINDAVPPYIITAKTVDVDGDGMIDHIRFQFSEPIDDSSLTGYVTADSLTGDASSVWDIADYTGEVWNLYDPGIAAPSGSETQAGIDGQPLFKDNAPDNAVLYLMVDEGSGPSSPNTGAGDTDATPGIMVSEDVTLVDFKPNTFEYDPGGSGVSASASVQSASDNAGPAIVSSNTTSTTTVMVTFSEDIDDGTVAPADDFIWKMGTSGPLQNSQDNVISHEETSPGILWMQVQPSLSEWPEGLTGTIALDTLEVISDASEIKSNTRDAIRNARNTADSTFTIPTVDVGSGATMLDPVDMLTAMDYPDDNGGFVLLTFDFSQNHPGVSTDPTYRDNPINIYRIFRKVMDEDNPLNGVNVAWAHVEAAVPPAGRTMMRVLVAAIDGSPAEYTVRAEISPGTISVVSNAAVAKSSGPYLVATLNDGSAHKGLRPIISALSPMAVAAAVDNIAPNPAPFFTAQDALGSDSGVLVSWEVSPSDRIVYGGLFNGSEYVIRGVTGYEVYRDGELIGTAAPGATSFTDTGVGLGQLSDYMIYVVDGTEGHEQASGVVTSIAVKETERGNFNGDQAVDGIDLSLFAVFFGTSETDDPSNRGMFQRAFDLNGDGEVDGLDLSEFAVEFGKTVVAAKSVPRVESSYSLSDAKLRFLPVMDDSGVLVFLEVRVVDAEDLGAYAFDLVYDPSDLTYREGELGDWLGSNGSQGLLQFIQEVEEGRIRVFGAIAGGDRAESTVSGEGILARLMFSVHPSVEESAVVPEGLMVVDSEHDGAVIPLRNVSGGLITLLPSVYSLSQNHPNPFNPETTMRFTVPETGLVRVAIYNTTGQLVRQLMDKSLKRGRYTVRWDGRDDRGIETGSGIYFVRMEAGSFKTTKKMSLIK